MNHGTSLQRVVIASCLLLCFQSGGSFRAVAGPEGAPQGQGGLAPSERLITLLATNDIHGSAESRLIPSKPTADQPNRPPYRQGGMAIISGAIQAIRSGLNAKYGNQSGVVVLDAGDQFQGTLLSNYDEGQLIFNAMIAAGYDAAVPGNHDYDFGPIDSAPGAWQDTVTPGNPDQNPRGALERLIKQASRQFPLLSANTLFKTRLVDKTGAKISAEEVQSAGCQSAREIDFSRAERPSFLQPYLIKNVAGVRVAIIGLDTENTAAMTTVENVSDLCFREEKKAYLDVRRELEGKADVFVLIIHSGNTDTDLSASSLVEGILSEGGKNAVHAVIAGHTHFTHNAMIQGVPLIQSGSGAQAIGRVDLVWDTEAKALIPSKTKASAGLRLSHTFCQPEIKSFCSVDPATKAVKLEGQPLIEDPAILALIQEARQAIAPLAKRPIGMAKAPVKRDRKSESPLANVLTDWTRKVTGAEVALINTGGIRTDLPAGDLTYENLFEVFPFGNRVVSVYPMSLERIVGVLERSAKTCGNYGAMMQSGLRGTYERDCSKAVNDLYDAGRLLTLETLSGEKLYDVSLGGYVAPRDRAFQVATLDFLLAGGSSYRDLVGLTPVKDHGVIREVLFDEFFKTRPEFSSQLDGRWKEVLPAR